jgi:hypothetical protein
LIPFISARRSCFSLASVICRTPQALNEKHCSYTYIIPKVSKYISTDEYMTSAQRKILRTRK